MVLVDVGDLLGRHLVFILAFDAPEDDLVRVREPNGAVVVFEELALHAEDLNLVQL